jgi:hypothetical protein
VLEDSQMASLLRALLTVKLNDQPMSAWARVAGIARWEVGNLRSALVLRYDRSGIFIFVPLEDGHVALV